LLNVLSGGIGAGDEFFEWHGASSCRASKSDAVATATKGASHEVCSARGRLGYPTSPRVCH
jgi:hypothetical protein